MYDRELGADVVRVTGAREDQSPFQQKFDPTHPAADANGYVKMSNVSALIEMADLREAQRAYEANLNVIEASRSMMLGIVSLLKA
jgi:flagellar basal-body rod protein FlgC